MIAALLYEYGTSEWLNELRLLLVVGLVCALLLVALAVHESRPRRTDPPAETCKLHARPIGSCPPGSHDA